ncbi:MAG: ROK family protein, partial [Acidimicrobiia bacterium]|nr:ROK family protein [Acidimicrobiia bacterium]
RGAEAFSEAVGRPVTLLNDADAAGLAEMRFGAGRDHAGVVMMLTFGTGIGSGLFVDGRLVPNTEFGHMEINGMEAEHYAAGRLQEEMGMSFDDWGDRVSEVLGYLHRLFWPDLFIVGGGISKEWEEWSDRLVVPTQVVPAQLRNHAGIVGAALATAERVEI